MTLNPHSSKEDRQTRRRLLLDVTIAATTNLNTGIQRVVRNIARESESVSRELGIDCVPVVCSAGSLSPVGFDGRPRLDERCFRKLAALWMAGHQTLAGGLSRIKKGAGEKYLSLLSRLRKLLVPKTVIRSFSRTYRKLTGQSVQLQPNDILVLLDASWDLPLAKLLDAAETAGAGVATVVYDLIPVRYPNFHQQQLRTVFSDWLQQVTQRSDFMIGISRTVREDLLKYAGELASGTPAIPAPESHRFESFRLGADFAGRVPSCPAPASERTGDRLEKGNFYLAVGTIEPRKNHTFLLDAFDRIWQKNEDIHLAIAGKVGWMCEGIAERIRRHPLRNRCLHFIEEASDTELNWLYENGKALVFPSIVEGFGLPIVEAFHHRLPVLASDTPIHREVAGDQANFFKLDEPGSLVHAIEEIESGKELIRPNAHITSWEESCREFLSKICRHFESTAGDRSHEENLQEAA